MLLTDVLQLMCEWEKIPCKKRVRDKNANDKKGCICFADMIV